MQPEYEQAKIQEAKDTPTVQILDSPSWPIKKTKPKRVITVLVAGVLCMMLSIIAVYIIVNLEYLKSTDMTRYQQMNNIISQMSPKKLLKS